MLPKTYSESKYQDKLFFRDDLHDVAYFEHHFQGYTLEGRILYNQNHDQPRILSIHGARADSSKSDAVTIGLQRRGYSVLSLNMSGHSPAGVLAAEETSLANNIKEVEAFFAYLDPNYPKTIIGYSMGGTPALKLLEKHRAEISKLILFYPGIYDTRAYDVNFGPAFREILSEPYSYRNNDTLQLLRDFDGSMLLVHGEYDGLDPVAFGRPAGTSAGEVTIDGQVYSSPIPKEVFDLVYDAVPASRRERIMIPQCGHSVVLWMREHPKEAARFLDQLAAFLKS